MAAIDTFPGRPAQRHMTAAVAVTPSDGTDLTNVTRGLYVGGAGDLVVNMMDSNGTGVQVTIKSVAAGTWLPIRVSRILATGTAASLITAFW